MVLSDGDGFTLHDQLAKKWPGMRTIFFADELQREQAQRAIRTPGVVDCIFNTENESDGLAAVHNAVKACAESMHVQEPIGMARITQLADEPLSDDEWRGILALVAGGEYDAATGALHRMVLPPAPQQRIDLYRRLLRLYMLAVDSQSDAQSIYQERRVPPLLLDDDGWTHTVHAFAALFSGLTHTPETTQRNSMLIAQVEKYARGHLADDLSLSKMAMVTGRSASNLSKVFKQMTGMGYHDYIAQLRILQAAQLLRRRPQMRLVDIAASVGFSTTSYFIRVFREHFGITPSEYRKTCR